MSNDKSFKIKKVMLMVGIALLAFLAVIIGRPAVIAHGETCRKKVITDMAGREIEITWPVHKVACLTGAAYEKVFLLGESQKIVARQANHPPWMARTNPDIKNIATMSGEPNLEELIQRQVELVFPFYGPKQLAQMKDAGIAAVITKVPLGGKDDNEKLAVKSFVALIKKEMRLFGSALSEKAARRAEEWCKYYDRKVAYVLERTAKIPEGRRPKVYYVRGPDALTTHGCDQNIVWYGEMAGADMVLKTIAQKGIVKVDMEQIIAWNPDVILVGRQYSTDLVLKDPKWRNINAVRTGKVYVIPEGVFYWDGGSEGVLLMEFIAQKLYPDLFRDLDMKREIKIYYSKFYHYRLSSAEIEKILHGLSPDGKRVNRLQN
jgi:iron complex transport system substrate-binding protein